MSDFKEIKEGVQLTFEHIVFTDMFIISNNLQTIGDSFLGELTTKQWFIVATLSYSKEIFNTDKDITLSQLSELVGTSRQNVKQIALKLVEKGFIDMYKDKDDNRVLRLKITKKAIEYSNLRGDKDSLFLRGLFENFSQKELMIFFKLIEKFKNNVIEFKNNM